MNSHNNVKEAGRKGQFRENYLSEMQDKISASVKLSP